MIAHARMLRRGATVLLAIGAAAAMSGCTTGTTVDAAAHRAPTSTSTSTPTSAAVRSSTPTPSPTSTGSTDAASADTSTQAGACLYLGKATTGLGSDMQSAVGQSDPQQGAAALSQAAASYQAKVDAIRYPPVKTAGEGLATAYERFAKDLTDAASDPQGAKAAVATDLQSVQTAAQGLESACS